MPYEIRVAGVPALVGVNGDGYYATVTFQNVFINGSPVVIYLDPPVATIGEINIPALLFSLLALLANGAEFQAL